MPYTGGKKKNMLDTDLDHKKIDIHVKWFHLISKVHIMYFFRL